MQVLIESNTGEEGSALEREFFILRKLIEKERTKRFVAEGADPADFYICTLSTRIIVYKVSFWWRVMVVEHTGVVFDLACLSTYTVFSGWLSAGG